jgi:hypothetical protein
MEVLKEWPLKLQLVRTKKGAVLYRIVVDDNWFFLEQNPLKNSKYGYAYRTIKEKFPEFFMFWELKNNRYTRRLLIGSFLEKKEIDQFLGSLLSEIEKEEFGKLEDKAEEETKETLEDLKE